MSYRLQIDPSGRASCRGACKEKIEKGRRNHSIGTRIPPARAAPPKCLAHHARSLRFGSAPPLGSPYDSFFWRKLCCMTKRVCQNAMAAHGSIDNIPGFDGLDESQRAEVRIVFDNLLNTEARPPATTTTKKKKAEPEADQEADELPEPADEAAAAPAQVGTKRKKQASTKKSDKARACPHLTMSEPRRVKHRPLCVRSVYTGDRQACGQQGSRGGGGGGRRKGDQGEGRGQPELARGARQQAPERVSAGRLGVAGAHGSCASNLLGGNATSEYRG